MNTSVAIFLLVVLLYAWYRLNNTVESYYPYFRRRLPYWRRNVLNDWSWAPYADRYVLEPHYSYFDY